jgi:hypothetical protein
MVYQTVCIMSEMFPRLIELSEIEFNAAIAAIRIITRPLLFSFIIYSKGEKKTLLFLHSYQPTQ